MEDVNSENFNELLKKKEELLERYKKQIAKIREILIRLSIASCTCLTKSTDMRFHSSICDYRIIEEMIQSLPDEPI